jgi:hypothetical protein
MPDSSMPIKAFTFPQSLQATDVWPPVTLVITQAQIHEGLPAERHSQLTAVLVCDPSVTCAAVGSEAVSVPIRKKLAAVVLVTVQGVAVQFCFA